MLVSIWRIAMYLFSAASGIAGIYALWILLRRLFRPPTDSRPVNAFGTKILHDLSPGMLSYLVIFLVVLGCAFAWAAVNGPLGSPGDPEPIQSPDFTHF